MHFLAAVYVVVLFSILFACLPSLSLLICICVKGLKRCSEVSLPWPESPYLVTEIVTVLSSTSLFGLAPAEFGASGETKQTDALLVTTQGQHLLLSGIQCQYNQTVVFVSTVTAHLSLLGCLSPLLLTAQSGHVFI